MKIPSGRRVLKTKIFKGKYEQMYERIRRGSNQKKEPLWGENGYFLEEHNVASNVYNYASSCLSNVSVSIKLQTMCNYVCIG